MNLEHSELILQLDRQQSRENPNAQRCRVEPEKHGRLGVHASGNFLMCGKCPYQEPASIPTADGQQQRVLVGQ